MYQQQTEQPDGTTTTTWHLYSSQILAGFVVAVLGLGTVVYRLLEDWGWIDSFYFSVITLTTVGYGDLAPTSPESKLFTSFYLITGISLLGAALNEITKRRRNQRVSKRARRAP